MTRPHFSQKERARLFVLHGGICELCGGKIDGTREAFDIEHRIPWAISRDNSDENLRLAHRSCHKEKTAVDAGVIAKVKRIEAKFTGMRPASRNPLPGSRASGIRKRMNGTVEFRNPLWPVSSREEHDDVSD